MISLEEFEEVWGGEYNPWLSYMWKVIQFPTINGRTIPAALAESVQLPMPTFEPRSKRIASTEIYYAGGSQVGQFSITFGVDQRHRAMRYIEDWQHTIQNPFTGGFNLPSVYKKDMQIALVDNTGDTVGTATIRNCWPLGSDAPAMDGGDNSPVITVPFQVDARYFTWSK